MSIRILAVSDGVVPTGLARITHNILRRLSTATYDIHHLAVNYFGDPHDLPWKVYPAATRGDQYGFRRIGDLAVALRPDIILIINDIWVVGDYLEALKTHWRHSAKIVASVPVESDPVDSEWLLNFGVISKLVVWNHFAREQMLNAWNGAGRDEDVVVIPLGVDTAQFFPIDGGSPIAKARLGLFSEADIPGSFIVLNANRNQPRKRIDITLKAFAMFAVDKPKNVKLYLHMGVADAGWNVLTLAKRLGIDNRLVLSTTGGPRPSVSNEDLNLIYNACDVGLNTSACEGWGLVSFEHAATKKAQVMSELPSLANLWEGSAIFAPANRTVVMENTNINGYLVDEPQLAQILERLYCEESERSAASTAAFMNATKPEYCWEAIVRSWDALFRALVA